MKIQARKQIKAGYPNRKTDKSLSENNITISCQPVTIQTLHYVRWKMTIFTGLATQSRSKFREITKLHPLPGTVRGYST
jgi:hypothetical protein